MLTNLGQLVLETHNPFRRHTMETQRLKNCNAQQSTVCQPQLQQQQNRRQKSTSSSNIEMKSYCRIRSSKLKNDAKIESSSSAAANNDQLSLVAAELSQQQSNVRTRRTKGSQQMLETMTSSHTQHHKSTCSIGSPLGCSSCSNFRQSDVDDESPSGPREESSPANHNHHHQTDGSRPHHSHQNDLPRQQQPLGCLPFDDANQKKRAHRTRLNLCSSVLLLIWLVSIWNDASNKTRSSNTTDANHRPFVSLASAQQYRPDWPHKSLEQEIFLLNLEDGYFGCQVNSSQDFLQLFELSRLCDGQAQCYLGTDELELPLKCKNRSHCGSPQLPAGNSSRHHSSHHEEPIRCVNGVCLDGLCYCNDGFGGKSCDIPDENECKFRPCDVFAHCTNTMGSYYCSCFPGYDGDGIHCQDINECEIPSLRALCADNTECVNLPGHFICKCNPGYQQSDQSQSSLTGAPIGNTTVQCTDIDECLDERSCGKGAVCENLPGSFRCSCPAGFTGDPAVECLDMDECRNNPCGIGAQCTNIPGGYRCSCAQGFERNPAAPANLFGTIQLNELQQQQQQLTDLTNSTIVACLDINECQQAAGKSSAACGQGAQCVNTAGGYFCQCPPGFNGNPKIACADIDECQANACGPNTQCSNAPGHFKCECKPGYTGNAYSPAGCQDEDECLRKEACGVNAQCFNTLGAYECTCQSGYAGDPYSRCHDINECSPGPGGNPNPCGPGAHCENLQGGYRCTCPEKYLARGTPEMGCERAAVDIGCQTDFDCTQNAQCSNSTCQCKLGYQINGIDCVDVDECSVSLQQQQQVNVPIAPVKAFTRLNLAATKQQQHQLHQNASLVSLCGPEATCRNLDGSYLCECKAGYEKVDPQQANSKCRDVNECEQSATPPCGQNSKCFNTEGSFKCACNDGFIPIDQDPTNGCKSPCDGVNCGQHATCKPHGEEAACVCKPGFTFDPSNIKLGCVDINECETTNHSPSGLCGSKAICTNEPGSYSCQCPPGYSGDAYRYCEDINECDRRFGVFGQCGELAVCTNKPGSFSCACAPGYSGDPKTKCADIDECSAKFGPNGKCGLNAVCTNLPGRYACQCPPGYSGDPNEQCTPEQPPCNKSSDCRQNEVCQSGRCSCPFEQQQQTGGQRAPTCKHPCDKIECGPHATCQLDSDNQALCVCDAGYMAPSDGRSGCVDVNECIQGVTLSGITPISAGLINGGGSIAMGPTTLAPQAQNATGGGHPCGRNALCRNQPGSFDCVCPPGYSGNAYESCALDVRSQQQQQQQTITTQVNNQQQSTTTTTNSFMSNYQQEPRTTACGEQCPAGQVCSDGQCVRSDACRDNQDCKQAQACEHVNQLLGFQCVNVCELNQCGPRAKCTAQNHKPICTCDSSVGLSGDPYDLAEGCRRTTTTQTFNEVTPSIATTTTTKQQQQQQITTTSPYFTTKFGGGSLPTKQDQQHGGDISTVSFDYVSPPSLSTRPQQQTLSSSHNATSTTTMDQLQRQQTLDLQQQTKRPSQPLVAYEVPLPTTPILPQFDTFSTTASLGQQQQNITTTQQSFSSTEQARGPGDVGGQTLSPFKTSTTSANTQKQQSTATTQNLFTTKRKPVQQQQQQQQQQVDAMISNNRQDTGSSGGQSSDLTQKQAIEQKQQQEDRQTQFELIQQQQLNATRTSSQFGLFAHKQVACTNDQHCPGNLFCLGASSAANSYELIGGNLVQSNANQLRFCGCPAEYRREADYCYINRVNCSSAAVCKAREECIPASVLRQYYSTTVGSTNPPYLQLQQTTISQQFSLDSDGSQQAFPPTTSGVCICPRGYKLTANGLACLDRNECDEGTPCAVGAICQNKIGSYECVCPPGTLGEPYTKTCEPIKPKDECLFNSECPQDRECDQNTRKCVSPCHICGPRAVCTATNHAAICLCPPRFTGNAIDQVYGCQEPVQTTTTSTAYTTTTSLPPTTTQSPARQQQQQTTTAIGVPVTTLLPHTTLAPLATTSPTTSSSSAVETTTPELPEFRTIPPSELFVMCLADGIQVEVQLGGFDGIIYVKGHSQDPKCRKLVMSSNANEFVDFKVQFGHCDLIHRDGEAGFVLVIQKHPKLVTYRARAYHVKCVYNTGERTVTLGFNVSMITTSGTIANTGPPPTCLMSITALDGREVASAEIGQDLLLRVDVQPDSIYGGFARSCEAKTMDDEGEYQYEVTDANGCATDPSIFSDWQYDQQRKSLVARFNAFKFPSSNNLRFQCNIRVCFGSCPAVNCNGIDAIGKRRKRRDVLGSNSTTTSNRSGSATNGDDDDDGDDSPTDELIVSDAFKEGALREEIMVQSNAILTFDKKEASLPQQQRPPVEDIEFVCLPRLGIVLSIGLTTLLALLALTIGTSCWCFAKKKRALNGRHSHNGPLPHPMDFPNPLLRSGSASTLSGQSMYGP